MDNAATFRKLLGDDYRETSYEAIAPTRPDLSTEGKAVVVTGGGRGIGRGIAESFAKSGAAYLFLWGRSLDSLKASKAELNARYPGTVTHICQCDIARHADVKRAVAAVVMTAGRLDILVNNAGYLPEPATLTASKPSEWWRTFEVNVKGGMNVIVQALQTFKTPMVVLNVTSVLAHVGPFPLFSAYSASKLAFARTLECFRVENPGLIRTLSFHPGMIETGMLARSGIDEGHVDDMSLPSDFAVWAASPEAAFLDGRTVRASWDIKHLMAHKKLILDENLFTVSVTAN